MEKPSDYAERTVDQDGLWKKVIGELFEDFLLFFAPDLYEQVEFTKKPDFLQQELFQEVADRKKGRRSADQLVKVYLIEGGEQWILIHIEVQGVNEEDFSKRMFQYFYRIFDRYEKKIAALAIMTSPYENNYPKSFQYDFLAQRLIMSILFVKYLIMMTICCVIPIACSVKLFWRQNTCIKQIMKNRSVMFLKASL
ncbi:MULTISPECIES: hypothetical protein [unclassified Sporosarcina]|uniref:hypothetical protein n=1 Tax=unclassified Sporosarcina TaxID=2647733 RepID=UPI00203EFDAC|nr:MULTISPECIES: hypothetical protein [unclassified Sporosarcina]